MTREAFRARAGGGRPSGDNEVFLRYLDLAKICPEFPVDLRQEMEPPEPRPQSAWTRRMFSWATRRFLEN
jgi:hypothetical protein